MADTSSYLRYLPPVLWQHEPPPPAISVGAMLRIFEKILTGIDDNEPITHGKHSHEAIEATIARMHRVFNPRYTPPEFLDWLGSWVALEFSGLWDDYQRRKIATEIIGVYKKRGRKEGLDQYLDLYTVAEKRPRIAVDHASKVLYTRPQPGRFAPIHTLISQGPSIAAGVLAHEGLIRPLCIVRSPDGSFVVGDAGTPQSFVPIVPKGVWLLPPPGRYEFAGVPLKPQRIGPATFRPALPIAIATDNGVPWNLYVLDNVFTLGPAATALYELTSPGFPTATALATMGALGTVWPIAMSLDVNGHLLILDRGTPAPSGAAAAPVLIDVQIAPLAITSRALAQVVEPTSLLVMPNGDVWIGDAGQQNAAVPADIVRLDRVANTETVLLAALPAGSNPLTAPTALVRKDDTHVHVLDLGLKPYASSLDPVLAADPFRRHIAEPPTIYEVDVSGAVPAITRTAETRQLVFPTGMALDGETLYVCDRGEYSDPSIGGPMLRVWRASPYEFGVVVHFSEQHPTTQLERRRIVQDVFEIVRREKPTQTDFTMVYSV